MTRLNEPDEAELRANFEQLLADGPPFPTETGLDEQTFDAIIRVWAAAPNPPAALIDAARREFAAQLDGTHEREARAREDAAIEAAVARKP